MGDKKLDFLKKILSFLKDFIVSHKVISSIIALVLVMAIGATSAIIITTKNKDEEPEVSSEVISSEESSVVLEEVSSQEETSSEEVSSQPVVSSKVETVVSTPKPQTTAPVVNQNFNYNTNIDIDNNVFLDALVYTGYNLNKHRADGLMWQYVLASQKRGKGWLSNIGYAGGCTGYETSNGLPDIKRFEKGGLVCASYVTYVYFNYLPNVAGIDTSSLTRPDKSYSAQDWYVAAKDWVAKGYSKYIDFSASLSGGYIKFNPAESIPIGSIMAFSDARKPGSKACSHMAIYAGYKNGYHWVYHVGNENGPEFCAVERMNFGPDPQWPLAVITTPANIRMVALLEVSVKSADGAAMSGVAITLKNNNTGVETALGVTNNEGILITENLSYGDFTVIQTVPSGYTCDNQAVEIKLTTANNSYNKVGFVNNLLPPPPESVIEESSSPESSDQTSSEEVGDTGSDSTSTNIQDTTTNVSNTEE